MKRFSQKLPKGICGAWMGAVGNKQNGVLIHVLPVLALLTSLTAVASDSPPVAGTFNIALGATAGSGTSEGWGGGTSTADLFDGQTSYTTWNRGLAFTGGRSGWQGACGGRQLIIDLGAQKKVSAARLWHHGLEHIPNTAALQAQVAGQWVGVGGTVRLRKDLDSATAQRGYGAVPTEYIFTPLETRFIRYSYDNCQLKTGHGWLYEAEIFSQTSSEGFIENFDSPNLNTAWEVFSPANPRPNSYGPPNEYSLTDSPGKLRFRLRELTYGIGHLRNYENFVNYYTYNPSLEVRRSFSGSKWKITSRVNYHMPRADGNGQFFGVVFGEPGSGSYFVGIELYRHGGYGLTNVYSIMGDQHVATNLGCCIPTDFNLDYRIEREGSVVSIFWKLDGGDWSLGMTRDLGDILKNSTPQKIHISGTAWFVPLDSYADYDHVRLETGVSPEPGNIAPVAMVGVPRPSYVGGATALDGSKSFDPDGQPLSVVWSWLSRPVDSAAAFHSTNSLKTGFVPDRAGTYVAKLTVSDPAGLSSSAAATVMVTPKPPLAPKAIVVPKEVSVGLNVTVRLNGAESTGGGSSGVPLIWMVTSKPEGSSPVLTQDAHGQASFRAAMAGVYRVQLRVQGEGGFDTAEATVTVTQKGTSPPAPQPVDCRHQQSADNLYFFACNGRPVTQKVKDSRQIHQVDQVGKWVIWIYRNFYSLNIFQDYDATYYGNCAANPLQQPTRLSGTVFSPAAELGRYDITGQIFTPKVCSRSSVGVARPDGCVPYPPKVLPNC